MARPTMGIGRGGEACAASDPATGGRSRRHDRRCFGWLEQEDQRLKKHYGRWMDIVWSLELESCILTKLRKPSIPVNLVGPQVCLPPRWVPASRGVFIFLCVIRRHFRCVRADCRGNIFSQNMVGPQVSHQICRVPAIIGGIIIFRVIRRHFLAAAVDPAVSLSTYSTLLMEVGR